MLWSDQGIEQYRVRPHAGLAGARVQPYRYFLQVFLRQVNIGTAAHEFSWSTELSCICINVNQWIYLFCFFYLQVVSVLQAADYSSTGPGFGWSLAGRLRNLVVVISQVTATVDWCSLSTSSFRADMCWISVRM